MPLNLELIRTRIHLSAEPGPVAEATIRAIVAEAERYATERVESAKAKPQPASTPGGQGALFGGEVEDSHLDGALYAREALQAMREDLQEALGTVRGGGYPRAGLPAQPERV